MTPGDVARVLAACMNFDGRQMPEGRDEARQFTMAWFTVIGDLALEDALEAVRRHYMTSTKWAMPANIREGVKQLHRERERDRPNELRALPSRFEEDGDRDARLDRGVSGARSAMQAVFEAMARRNGSPQALSALEELRQITAQQQQADVDEREENQ